MEKKNVLIFGVMVGIFIYAIPTFFNMGGARLPFKIFGSVVMFAAIVYFIAFDVFTGGANYSKGIKKQLKAGEITPQEAIQLESQAINVEIARQQQLVQLEKQKAKLRELKNQGKSGLNLGSGAQGDKYKFPDVLGNIGGLMGGPQKQAPVQQQQPKQDTLSNLGAFVTGTQQQPVQPKKKRKKVKKRRRYWY